MEKDSLIIFFVLSSCTACQKSYFREKKMYLMWNSITTLSRKWFWSTDSFLQYFVLIINYFQAKDVVVLHLVNNRTKIHKAGKC